MVSVALLLGSTMPNQISHTIPPTVDVLLPEDLSNLGGPLLAGQAELVSLRGGRGVGRLTFVGHKLT